MPHEIGAYLGAVRNLADLKRRCRVDGEEDGCWHFLGRYSHPRVWVHGRGTVQGPRLAWEFTHGAVPAGHVVTRTCTSADCLRPKHLRCWTKREEIVFLQAAGRYKSAAKKAAGRQAGRCRATITDELRVWLIESEQSGVEVAHALGVSQGRVNALRADARKRVGGGASSVFTWRPTAAAAVAGAAAC